MSAYSFEQLVVDLLVAMGYGGSHSTVASATKRSGDGGIDGIINEDKLGLDVIYVQAKRWENKVGEPVVRDFVGALHGKKANKGVIITTSAYTSDAIKYAETVNNTKVVLVNGETLAKLMIDHDLGVYTKQSVAIKDIDTDYFEDL